MGRRKLLSLRILTGLLINNGRLLLHRIVLSSIKWSCVEEKESSEHKLWTCATLKHISLQVQYANFVLRRTNHPNVYLEPLRRFLEGKTWGFINILKGSIIEKACTIWIPYNRPFRHSKHTKNKVKKYNILNWKQFEDRWYNIYNFLSSK